MQKWAEWRWRCWPDVKADRGRGLAWKRIELLTALARAFSVAGTHCATTVMQLNYNISISLVTITLKIRGERKSAMIEQHTSLFCHIVVTFMYNSIKYCSSYSDHSFIVTIIFLYFTTANISLQIHKMCRCKHAYISEILLEWVSFLSVPHKRNVSAYSPPFWRHNLLNVFFIIIVLVT